MAIQPLLLHLSCLSRPSPLLVPGTQTWPNNHAFSLSILPSSLSFLSSFSIFPFPLSILPSALFSLSSSLLPSFSRPFSLSLLPSLSPLASLSPFPTSSSLLYYNHLQPPSSILARAFPCHHA
ncbi:unnamed protein product [Closterium sp. NIES-54]